MSTLPVASPLASSSSSARFAPARLSERAARAFSPRACLEGYALFVKSAVVVDRLQDGKAIVTVQGKRSRVVELRAESEELHASCTCIPSTLPLAPCRHLWAALLELDRRDAFPALQGTRGRVTIAVVSSGEAAGAPPPPAPPAKTRAPSKKAAARAAPPPKPSAKPARRRAR